MTWVVDTNLVIDVGEGISPGAEAAFELLESERPNRLVISPISYVELSPLFLGDLMSLEVFLVGLHINYEEAWSIRDNQVAAEKWRQYVTRKRQQRARKRPVADILIGAFACRFGGILTNNTKDFQSLFPELEVKSP